MNSRLVAVLEVLDVLLEMAQGVDREDVAVPGIVVEGVTVYGIWGLLRGQEEDGAGFGVGVVRFCC